ncbi:MAG: PilN domain-containing protein [Gammaproteobacteria bacterium]|nr:PilN domain-containing protein [Gammaproteobacteria bacterium]
MSRINLLPWREWERERRNRAFFSRLAASALIGLCVAALAGLYIERMAGRQDGRAAALRAQLAELDGRILRVETLRSESEGLEARMAVVLRLHDERSEVARVLLELARAALAGAHYETLSRHGDAISASGTAASAGRISALMRRLAASERFGMPTLHSIREDPDHAHYGGRAVHFDLGFPVLASSHGAEGG